MSPVVKVVAVVPETPGGAYLAIISPESPSPVALAEANIKSPPSISVPNPPVPCILISPGV